MMNIDYIVVDEIPDNCGECVLMDYINDHACCLGIAGEKIRELAGNPYTMTYRRSDCPLRLNTMPYCDVYTSNERMD